MFVVLFASESSRHITAEAHFMALIRLGCLHYLIAIEVCTLKEAFKLSDIYFPPKVVNYLNCVLSAVFFFT